MQFDEKDLYTGLATLHWSAYDDPSWDHDYFERIIRENGTPALEVACGAGRLLRRYLVAGLEVEGCDISDGMLTVCREKAAAQGLAPVLYEQAMQDLDLPRRYRTIYIPCGSFVVVMDLERAQDTLRRLHDHLEPGGLLAFNIFLPDYGDLSRVHEDTFPRPWQPWTEKNLPDGRHLKVFRRVMSLDPAEQYETEERRYELYDGDRLVAEEVHAGQYRWYGKHEMLLMLERAGFRDVQVKGDYTDEEFSANHTGTMVFLARKAEYL